MTGPAGKIQSPATGIDDVCQICQTAAVRHRTAFRFLGLGTQPPEPSLGLMVSEARTLADPGLVAPCISLGHDQENLVVPAGEENLTLMSKSACEVRVMGRERWSIKTRIDALAMCSGTAKERAWRPTGSWNACGEATRRALHGLCCCRGWSGWSLARRATAAPRSPGVTFAGLPRRPPNL